MKLHASAPGGAQVVTAYGDDYVTVSGVRYEQSIVVLPDRVQPWAARSFESLTEADFAALLQAGRQAPEAYFGVLLGAPPQTRAEQHNRRSEWAAGVTRYAPFAPRPSIGGMCAAKNKIFSRGLGFNSWQPQWALQSPPHRPA